MGKTTGVLLVNLGTPDSPEVGDVRRYLREFLMDGRVIDIPAWQRFLLVQGIIAPFRAPNSAAEYRKLWTDAGSPLLIYGKKVRDLLQERLGDEYQVELGMRYQNPSIRHALDKFAFRHLKKLVVIPLYPQYASASTGSSIEKVLEEVRREETFPQLEIISQFFDHPIFLETFAAIGRSHMGKKDYDHFLFTYHGLPERQIRKSSTGYCQLNLKCCSVLRDNNRYCYRAQCYETTRLLVQLLGIDQGRYTVSFQSRLGRDPWIKPYTDKTIEELAGQGVKRILAFSPSFVADCLETTVEIGETYHEQFVQQGGECLDLVESLNEHPRWVECLKDMVLQAASATATTA